MNGSPGGASTQLWMLIEALVIQNMWNRCAYTRRLHPQLNLLRRLLVANVVHGRHRQAVLAQRSY